MADTLQLQIATPERQLVDETVTTVEIPGREGYLGILPDHAPLLGQLGAGVLSFSSSSISDGDGLLAVDGGFIEIMDNHVRVLAEHAEFGRDINLEEARRRLAEAQETVEREPPVENIDEALAALRAAQARVDVAEQLLD
jgi:F-type H+-transporting ATPase subunit epsilon